MVADVEKINASNDQTSREIIEEKLGQIWNTENWISIFTQLLNQLIHDNSAETTPTAGSRVHRPAMRP